MESVPAPVLVLPTATPASVVPLRRCAAAAARAAEAKATDAIHTIEVPLNKTEQIDSYLSHLRNGASSTTSTTFPHFEAKALQKVFGASAPDVVKVEVSERRPTPEPKPALQKFLNIPKIPEGVPMDTNTSDAPVNQSVVAANATRSSRNSTRHKRKKGHAHKNRTGTAAKARRASPTYMTREEHALQGADAAVARAEATIASQLAKAKSDDEAPAMASTTPQVTAQQVTTGAKQHSFSEMRESFSEADRTLGSAQPEWQESAPIIAASHITDESIQAAGNMAMTDLFSEADRIVDSAVDGQ